MLTSLQVWITTVLLNPEYYVFFLILIPLIGVLAILFTGNKTFDPINYDSNQPNREKGYAGTLNDPNSVVLNTVKNSTLTRETILYNIALFFSLFNLLISVVV